MSEIQGNRWKNIMKCYPFEEKRLAKWSPPYIVQPKYDGVRCRAIPLENGSYLLVSSEENIIYSVPHLNEVFEFIHPNAELDGELYCHGMRFEEILSITSRTVNLHPDHQQIQFHCFDVINNQSQMQRALAIEDLRDRSPFIRVAPFYVCENLDDILRVYDDIVANGFEGIIVRNINAPYECKRSLWVMKFKPKKEDEYEITGYKEEYSKDGMPKGRLGAIICKSGDGNEFFVGSGYDDSTRNSLWSVKETLVGKNIRVKYQHITVGNKVPRFPVFVEVIENESR